MKLKDPFSGTVKIQKLGLWVNQNIENKQKQILYIKLHSFMPLKEIKSLPQTLIF